MGLAMGAIHFSMIETLSVCSCHQKTAIVEPNVYIVQRRLGERPEQADHEG